MKLITRAISLLLTALILLSCVACANSQNEENQTTTNGETEAPEAETTGGEMLDLPDVTYGGAEIKFVTRDESEWSTVEIFQEEESADPIPNAVYNRNLILEENYKVKIIEYKTTDMVGTVKKASNADPTEYAAICGSLDQCSTLATNGSLAELSSLEYLNLEKSWWDSKAVSGLSIGNKVYCITGDLFKTDNDATFILMFNKTIQKNKNIKDLYTLVNNKEWTFDEMNTMIVDTTSQLDGDPKLEYNKDLLGLAMTGDVAYSLFYASGCITTAKNADDIPEYALDINRVSDVVDSANRFYGNSNYSLNMEKVNAAGVLKNGLECFGGGHAFFYGECLQCVIRLRGHDVDFGVIPYPMFDSAQKNYYSYMHKTGGMVCIPKVLPEEEMNRSAVILEAMAYYSKQLLTPAYYEITLKTKAARDEESGPMIDMILESRVFDLAYVYNWGNLVSTIATQITTGGKSLVSKATQMQSKYTTNMKRTLKTFGIQ